METIVTSLIIGWILWLLLVSMAVYQKWKRKKELMFYVTYAFLGLGLAVFVWIAMSLPVNTPGDTTLSVGIQAKYLLIIKNFSVMMVMTIFLQISVWWFTHHRHRD